MPEQFSAAVLVVASRSFGTQSQMISGANVLGRFISARVTIKQRSRGDRSAVLLGPCSL